MTVVIGVAPNAFKGSLSAIQATQAIALGLQQSNLQCRILYLPMADGGDGTLEVMLAQPGAQRRVIEVQGPLGQPVRAAYGILPDGETALVEMALASGLALVSHNLNPMVASTYGTGQLIRHAIESGAKRVLVGVGGSATIDGGAGCLQALGVNLLDRRGKPLQPGGESLGELVKVEPSPIGNDIEILVMCDVDNPPLGENGAAHVFGPQKGADHRQIAKLEKNIGHFFTLIAHQTGTDVRELSGGGAAGALAGGLAALMNAKLVPGASTLIDYLRYDEQIQGCDLLITGEGQLDSQTISGKAPAIVAALAAKHRIPTIALAGSITIDSQTLATNHIDAAFPIVRGPVTRDEALQHAADWLTETAHAIGNLLATRYN